MRPPSRVFAVQERFVPFRKFGPGQAGAVVFSFLQTGGTRKEGNEMAKERFVEVYNQGLVNVMKIVVDTETGVNYVLGSHNKVSGTGMTVLLGADGKPLITPVD